MATVHRKHLGQGLSLVGLLAGCIVFGTAWHELVGHGLFGLALGGRIESVDILGIRVYPVLTWVGTGGFFGRCNVVGIESTSAAHIVALAGSMSTWVTAVIATGLLRMRQWAQWVQVVLLGLSLWWVDLLTYTLPSFGLRRYVLFGRRFREPYDAAVALGIPGPLFQAFVIITCASVAWFSIRFWFRFLTNCRASASQVDALCGQRE